MKVFVVSTKAEEFDIVVDDRHTISTATLLEHSAAVENFHLKDSVQVCQKDLHGCHDFVKWL